MIEIPISSLEMCIMLLYPWIVSGVLGALVFLFIYAVINLDWIYNIPKTGWIMFDGFIAGILLKAIKYFDIVVFV